MPPPPSPTTPRPPLSSQPCSFCIASSCFSKAPGPSGPQGTYNSWSLCLDLSSPTLLRPAASCHLWGKSIVPSTERISLITQSKVAPFPSHKVTRAHHPVLSSSQLSSLSEIIMFIYFFPFFLSVSPYENIRSMRVRPALSTKHVLNQYLTMNGLLRPEDHFCPGFSQLALQDGEPEWKQPDSPEASVPG